jgi:hypothetical protein
MISEEIVSQIRVQHGLHAGERFLEHMQDDFVAFARAIEQAVLAKLGAQEPVAWRCDATHEDDLCGEEDVVICLTESQAKEYQDESGYVVTTLYAATPIPAGMAQDAARYQWLRNSARSVDWSKWLGGRHKELYVCDCRTTLIEMDSAIDEAIAAAGVKP